MFLKLFFRKKDSDISREADIANKELHQKYIKDKAINKERSRARRVFLFKSTETLKKIIKCKEIEGSKYWKLAEIELERRELYSGDSLLLFVFGQIPTALLSVVSGYSLPLSIFLILVFWVFWIRLVWKSTL